MGSTFPDDYCLSSQIFEESSVAKATDCLALSCTDVRACLTAILK
jgi:hypothetical protein